MRRHDRKALRAAADRAEETQVFQSTTPDVLTLDQLAHYLQIPKSTLYKLLQTGRVPGKKVGRQWRFRREAIDAWLAEGPPRTPPVEARRRR